MKIHGLQKMTLLDYPGNVACTVFLGGCDFRCQFCHNYELVDGSAEPVMEDEEFFGFLSKRVGVLDGVCVTGGEPCLRPDLTAFIRRIKDMGFKVKLDTNGGHPDKVEELLDAGLIDYVAMDIKNSPSKYGMTIGLSKDQNYGPAINQYKSTDQNKWGQKQDFNLNSINRTIALLLENRIEYEFRTTVVEQYHTEADFYEIGKWISGAKKYFLQQYVPRDTVPDRTLEAPSRETMEKYVQIVRQFVPAAEIRGVE